MRERTYVWLKIASDDLDAAEHCWQGEKLLWAMFMCQQTVEKALKAVIFEKTGQTPPRKHDLISLAGDAGLLPGLDQETKKFCAD
ncbi:MAG: HEPN domain-containing protein [Desulfurispora sp.]|uniref:HEPN domain-containing protein n=1 Tax=Desulfurispora sp. TaxID=3014275 RepID=UPI004048FDCA